MTSESWNSRWWKDGWEENLPTIEKKGKIMTSEELKAVKIAWANGETVQHYVRGEWLDWLSEDSILFYDQKWRVKPKTIKINGYEVPQPVRKLEIAQNYYYASIVAGGFGPIVYSGDLLDEQNLSLGICHLTFKDARLHADALLSFTKD